MDISERISLARKSKGFTQEQLATLANVTVRTVQRIESGASIPRAYTIKTLAQALDISFDELNTDQSQTVYPDNAMRDDDKHTLRLLCLSCCSYLVIPFIHFLIPVYFLKYSDCTGPTVIAMGRRIIRGQIYWTAMLSFLLLMTVAYNFMIALYFDPSYLLHFLWVFFAMYFLNALIIVYNMVQVGKLGNEEGLRGC